MSAARSAPPSRSKMASSTTANGMALDYRRLDRNFGPSKAPWVQLGAAAAPLLQTRGYQENQRTNDKESSVMRALLCHQLTSFQGRARFQWNKNQFGPGF